MYMHKCNRLKEMDLNARVKVNVDRWTDERNY